MNNILILIFFSYNFFLIKGKDILLYKYMNISIFNFSKTSLLTILFCSKHEKLEHIVLGFLAGSQSPSNMEVPFWTVDAFTGQPFSGNPAAVCLLEEDLSDEKKQQIAREMNISETCYLTKVTRLHSPRYIGQND